MIKVKISTETDWPIINQTPGRKGIWKKCQFFINDNTYDCDYWFVLYGIDKPLKAKCPIENTYFVCGEPSSIHVYKKRFIEQFSNLISGQKIFYNVSRIIHYTALPWMIGGHFINGKFARFDKCYDELKNMPRIHKSKLLSVISSDKNFTVGHRKRLNFVERLREHFGENIDVFGRGINTFEDKWDTIAPYKYHIAIENDCSEHYFTEKIMDSYLGEAYPIYYGCNNIQEYYPYESLLRINIDEPEKAIALIEKAIFDNRYEKYYEKILQAKELTLDRYNIFSIIANEIENRHTTVCSSASEQWIYPENINFMSLQINKIKKIFLPY